MLKPGTVFDERFVIDSFLGVGGQGEVYKAKDQTLNRDVALKLMRASVVLSDKDRARFYREAQIIGQLQHQYILRCYHVGLAAETVYCCLEFADAPELASILASQTLAWTRSVQICAQVCEGMTYAHSKGVLHRDLTPNNILVFQDRVKIIDFGLAACSSAQQSLTDDGHILGTPHYISPEQWQGAAADERSDIYALGCILYHCLAGEVPFSGSTALAIGAEHVRSTFPPLKLPNVPGAVQQTLNVILQRALHKSRDKRYHRMSQFLTDLNKLQNQQTPVSVKPIRSQAMVAGSIIIAVALPAIVIATMKNPIVKSSSMTSGKIKQSDSQNSLTASDVRQTGLPLQDPLLYARDAAACDSRGDRQGAERSAVRSLNMLATAFPQTGRYSEEPSSAALESLRILKTCRLLSPQCIVAALPLAGRNGLSNEVRSLAMLAIQHEGNLEVEHSAYERIANAFSKDKPLTDKLFRRYAAAASSIGPEDPRFGAACVTAAELARINGDNITEFKFNSRLDPTNSHAELYKNYVQVAQFRLGQAALSLGKATQAESHFRKAASANLDIPAPSVHAAVIQLRRAECLRLMGKKDEAIAIVDHLLAKNMCNTNEKKYAIRLLLALKPNAAFILIGQNMDDDVFAALGEEVEHQFRAKHYRQAIEIATIVAALAATTTSSQQNQIQARIFMCQALMLLGEKEEGTKVTRNLLNEIQTGYKLVPVDFRRERFRFTAGLIGGPGNAQTVSFW
jgi:serine/threonine protein kinase